GDFVLTGGEMACIPVIDSIARMIPGVLSCNESFEEESFYDGLLEYPHYTRPSDFRGMQVPEVLLSGHHKNILTWQRKQSLLKTFIQRPDLLKTAKLSNSDQKTLDEIENQT
ncbi:MAG: tRNA (guanosine(37)-N1)-methyltransferase TrmD, partial [Christensenellaceae bacterium]